MSKTTEGRSALRTAVDDAGRMPFTDHLRELRNRLFKSVLAIIAVTIVAAFFYRELTSFLIEPICELDRVSGTGNNTACGRGVLVVQGVLSPLSVALKISLAAGIIAASPIWLYQLWAFLAPGLHRHEKRYAIGFVATGVPLFLCGAAIAYYIMPKALNILLGFTPDEANNQLPLDEYLSFGIRMIIVFGLAFELPLILMLLNLAGIVSAAKMASWWRLMVFGITVFAAIATPTPDPLTMLTLALPMCGLFFLALGLAWLNDMRRQRRRRRDPDSRLSPDEASVIDTSPSRLDDMDDIS